MTDLQHKIATVRDVYHRSRIALAAQERAQLAMLQAECGQAGHQWKWHQIVGEGRYCQVCELRDFSDD
jgi:hypothetical protein